MIDPTIARPLLDGLFSRAEGKFINLRSFPAGPNGYVENRFFPVGEVDRMLEVAADLAETHNVCVGVVPRDSESGKGDAVSEVYAIWVDCDTPKSTRAVEEFDYKPTFEVPFLGTHTPTGSSRIRFPLIGQRT